MRVTTWTTCSCSEMGRTCIACTMTEKSVVKAGIGAPLLIGLSIAPPNLASNCCSPPDTHGVSRGKGDDPQAGCVAPSGSLSDGLPLGTLGRTRRDQGRQPLRDQHGGDRPTHPQARRRPSSNSKRSRERTCRHPEAHRSLRRLSSVAGWKHEPLCTLRAPIVFGSFLSRAIARKTPGQRVPGAGFGPARPLGIRGV